MYTLLISSDSKAGIASCIFSNDVLLCGCRHYHASMTAEEREKTQYDWTHGKVQIIAATIAFGMGKASCCRPERSLVSGICLLRWGSQYCSQLRWNALHQEAPLHRNSSSGLMMLTDFQNALPSLKTKTLQHFAMMHVDRSQLHQSWHRLYHTRMHVTELLNS